LEAGLVDLYVGTGDSDRIERRGYFMMSQGNSPPRPYGRRRSTNEKRRDAEVRTELNARQRAWRQRKEIRKRVAEIRELPGICEAGKLTHDGKTYIKYFLKGTRIMNECSSDSMDYLMRLGRLLVEFRGKTQWEERRHAWLRQFEQDIGLKDSKANNLLRVWRRFREDLDKLRQFPRRKLLFIVGAKGLQPSIMPHTELIARMRSLDSNEIKKLTPEQLVSRLKGDKTPGARALGKATPPTIIHVAPGCKISLSPDFSQLTVDWGFSEEAFQQMVGEALKDRMARLLRVRENSLANHRKKK
jgi:hypothetical protein